MTISIADVLTIAGALIFFGFGIAYFYKSRSPKNHCDTIQKNMGELNDDNRMMMFALMRGAGGGAIAVAVIITWLQLQYLKTPGQWIPQSILVVSALFFLPAINGIFLVNRNSRSNRPPILLSLAMALIIAGYFFNIRR